MKSIIRLVIYILLPVLTLVLGWQLGVRSQEVRIQNAIQNLEYIFDGSTGSGSTISDPEQEVNIALLWSVWRLLLAEYIEPQKLETSPMLYGAVAGMVRAVKDPYTVFMTPKENTEFTDYLEGNLEGIGAELTLRNELVTVVAPLKGSPAKLAGLEPADIIAEVDGDSIVGKSLLEVVQLIRGPMGTEVTLGILRKDATELLQITIMREAITVPSVESEVKILNNKKIGYISINQFGENTATEVASAYTEVSKDPLDGLIIDVRYNGGGYLERAIDIVSMFLSEGKVVTVARRDSEPLTHFVHGRALNSTIPLVVLVNGGSASASEIVAGAFKDAKRATLIGTKTFGKGTVQEIFTLPGGASVRITIAKWLTPNGTEIDHNGIMPDIIVEQIDSPEQATENNEEDTDEQLQAALEYLATGKKPVQSGSGNTVISE